MTTKIIPGKEYVFVPRGNDGSLDVFHGRTFVPEVGPPVLHASDGVVGFFGEDDKPFFVFADELVDPEEE